MKSAYGQEFSKLKTLRDTIAKADVTVHGQEFSELKNPQETMTEADFTAAKKVQNMLA